MPTANIQNWNISPGDAPSAAHVGAGGFFPFGVSGVLRGAATCFYGFVGFDCIATSGEEVRRPQRAIPVAILGSLVIVCLSYLAVAAVLTLMWPYYDLKDDGAPLATVFRQVGWPVAQWVVAIGGIFGLVTSLFGTMFPLPRVVYAMATDGLIFRCLGDVHARYQTPFIGTILSGLLTGIMAALFHLQQLIDMLSIGTLMAYTLVAACVLLLRYRPCEDDETSNQQTSGTTNSSVLGRLINSQGQETPTKVTGRIGAILIQLYCLLSIGFAVCLVHGEWNSIPFGVVACIMTLILIFLSLQPSTIKPIPFKVPLVPIVPAISITMNIYLMFLLDSPTWIRFSIWMAVGTSLWLVFVAYRWCRRIPVAKSAASYDNASFERERQDQCRTSDIPLEEMKVVDIVDGIVADQDIQMADKKYMNGHASLVKDVPLELQNNSLDHNKGSVDGKIIHSLNTSSVKPQVLSQGRTKRFVRATSVIEAEFENASEIIAETTGKYVEEGPRLSSIDKAADVIEPPQSSKAKRIGRVVRPTSVQQGTVSFESVSEISSENADVMSCDGDDHSLYPEVFIMPSEDNLIAEDDEETSQKTSSEKNLASKESPQAVTEMKHKEAVDFPVFYEVTSGPNQGDEPPPDMIKGVAKSNGCVEAVPQCEGDSLLENAWSGLTQRDKGALNSTDSKGVYFQPDAVMSEPESALHLGLSDGLQPTQTQRCTKSTKMNLSPLPDCTPTTSDKDIITSGCQNVVPLLRDTKSSSIADAQSPFQLNEIKVERDEEIFQNNAKILDGHGDSDVNLNKSRCMDIPDTVPVPYDNISLEKPVRSLSNSEELNEPKSIQKQNAKLPNFSLCSYGDKPIDCNRKTSPSLSDLKSTISPEKFQDPNFLEKLNKVISQQSFRSYTQPRVIKRQPVELKTPPGKPLPQIQPALVDSSDTDSDDEVFPRPEVEDTLSRETIRKRLESVLSNGPSRVSLVAHDQQLQSLPKSGVNKERREHEQKHQLPTESDVNRIKGSEAKSADNDGSSEDSEDSSFNEKLSAILKKRISGSLPPMKHKKTTEELLAGGHSLPERKNSLTTGDEADSDSKKEIRNTLESLFSIHAKRAEMNGEEISTAF